MRTLCARLPLLLGICVAISGAPRAARACSIAYTTIPDASGFVLCSGLNSDATSMTWKVGGSITYVGASSQYYTQGYKNIGACADGNPNIIDPLFQDNPAEGRLILTSSVKYGEILHMKAKITYTAYPGTAGTTVLWDADFDSAPSTTWQAQGGFTLPQDVKNVQYKCVSWELAYPTSTWTAATPYL